MINHARIDYKTLITNKRYNTFFADDLPIKEYLAYALEKEKFSKEEIKKIPFEQGDTVKTFSEFYRERNLLSKLRKELLNPKPLLKIKKTMCHHTLKCVVCCRHLFFGCSEIEYKQYTTS